jgi:hypothetical protein
VFDLPEGEVAEGEVAAPEEIAPAVPTPAAMAPHQFPTPLGSSGRGVLLVIAALCLLAAALAFWL